MLAPSQLYKLPYTPLPYTPLTRTPAGPTS